jgi:uncharacterized protein (TIGR00255 family)
VRSMTGYGERSFEAPGLRGKVSIKSLNHRFFDWNYKGVPLGEIENKWRGMTQKKLKRGRLEVALDLTILDPSGWEVFIDEGLLEKILSTLEKASARVGRVGHVSVDNIFRIPQVIELKRKDLSAESVSFLGKSFEETLADVLRERSREGRETALQIRRHLRRVRQALGRIERRAKKQPFFIREKLKQRLKDIDSRLPAQEGKMEEEVAYLAQRADIAEEILRLHSHIDSFEKLVQEDKDEPVGKMLDFISQEMYREANTINSKSQDISITNETLAIKGEVESIRQHVQNIE